MAFSCNGSKLLEGLSNIATASLLLKKQAECHIKAFKCLSKWAADNDNAAIKDVVINSNDVFKIFAEKLVQLACEQEGFIKELKKIEQTETSIKCAEKKLERSLEKEKKYEKEIKRYSRSSSSSFFKTKKSSDLGILHNDLKTAKNATLNAKKELSDIKAEMEVVKMFRFRKGMEKMSVAWRNFSNDISSIFACQQELVKMVPAVATEDVREMFYEGACFTKSIVNDLKKKLNCQNSSFPDSNDEINSGRLTTEIPYLIKKDETTSLSVSINDSNELEKTQSQTSCSPEKLSYHSDYSSSSSIEVCENEGSFTTVTKQSKEFGYESLYPSLSPNPYKEKEQQMGNKNYFKSHPSNSTTKNTLLLNTNVKSQYEVNDSNTTLLIRKSI